MLNFLSTNMFKTLFLCEKDVKYVVVVTTS